MPTTELASGSGYPLFGVFWTLLWVFLWVVWIFLLVRIITDVFRSRDLSGWAKAAWTVALILLPLITALIYLVVRGDQMHERDRVQAAQTDRAMRSYIRSAAGNSTSVAEEIGKLADLRDRGELTPDEYAALKARLMSNV